MVDKSAERRAVPTLARSEWVICRETEILERIHKCGIGSFGSISTFNGIRPNFNAISYQIKSSLTY